MASVAVAPPMPHAFGIGHRGARLITKENTLESFRKCVEKGIKMIEFDINITSDNVLVIYHDQHMSDNRAINQMTFAEFQAYDHDFPSVEGMFTDPAIMQSGIMFNFDIKDRLATVPLMRYLQSLAAQDTAFAARCFVASFETEDVTMALSMRSSDPSLREMRIGGIFEDEEGHTLADNAAAVYMALGYDFLSLKSCLATAELIKACHDNRLLVFSWTLNTEEECERLRGMGLDGYCGDDVDLLLKFQEPPASRTQV